MEEAAGKKETEDDDDDTVLQVKQDSDLNKLSVAPRWPTRVFAIDCLLKILGACEGNRAHFDLALAKELNLQSQGASICIFCNFGRHCIGFKVNWELIMTCCAPCTKFCLLVRNSSLCFAGDYLVLHLSELVRMAFIAATSDSDKLRLAGLAALQVG